MAPEAVTEVKGPSVVLIASRFYDEMRRQLLDLGYAEEKILRIGDLLDHDRRGSRSGRGSRRTTPGAHPPPAHPDRHLVVFAGAASATSTGRWHTSRRSPRPAGCRQPSRSSSAQAAAQVAAALRARARRELHPGRDGRSRGRDRESGGAGRDHRSPRPALRGRRAGARARRALRGVHRRLPGPGVRVV